MSGKKRCGAVCAICLAAALLAGLFAGCEKNNGVTPDGRTIIQVYRGRSSGMIDGEDDEKVTEAIQDKFEQDTGKRIKLQMQLETNTEIPRKVDLDYGKKDKQMDLVFHYISEDVGSAILKYAKEAESVKEVESLLASKGTDILEKIRENDPDRIAEKTGYVLQSDGSLKMTIIPGVYQEKQYGILLRKDLMEKVKSNTGMDPEDYDVANDGYQNMTFAQFDRLLRAFKTTGGDMQYPIVGYPWDIARVVAPCFGVDALGYGLDENGKLVPSQLTPNFDRYIDTMYRWAKDGIWAADSNNKSEVMMRSDFMVGKSACFIVYPEINNLIAFNRQLKIANAVQGAEYMMIAPLAESDREGNPVLENDKPKVNGFLKNNKAFGGVIIPEKSKNAELVVEFLNWMYSDQDNYDLCKYGIKGEHWVEGPDKTINGVTYKTWQYPDAKYDKYNEKPPYSGMWEILPNLNVSNRMRADLMVDEEKWYQACTFDNPALSNPSEGVWLPKVSRTLSSQAQNVDGKYVENVRSMAWAGLNKNGKTPVELLEEYLQDVRATCAEYLNAVDSTYQTAKTMLNEKFA